MDFHGNLPQERFGDLETTLVKINRVKPIADAGFYSNANITELAEFTDWTAECMRELLQLYPISAEIFHVRLWEAFPNAFATSLYNGGYIICFYEALFGALLYAAHNILLAPVVQQLLGIDQAGLPVADKGLIPNLFTRPASPSADMRDAWELMTFIAHRFIIYHEFQHLKAGHVDWLHNGAKSQLLMEAVGTRQGLGEESCRTLHALEMDADSFALVHCLGDAASMLEASKVDGDNSLLAYFTRYDEALVKLVCLSVFVFFRVMDNDLLKRFDNPFERSHPNGANRILLLGASGGRPAAAASASASFGEIKPCSARCRISSSIVGTYSVQMERGVAVTEFDPIRLERYPL